MTSNRPIFMATHPRACSTAFERVFMTRRKSLCTIHEPFGDAFYFGPERMSSRFEGDEQARLDSGFADSTFASVFNSINDAANGNSVRFLIKDMVQYLVPPEHQEAHLAPSLIDHRRGVGTEDVSDKDSAIDMNSRPSTPPGKSIEPRTPDSPRSTTSSNAPFPYDTPKEPRNPTVVPREILEKFHFTFLIRHPRSSVPSYYRCCVPPLVERTHFDDYMPNEAGYDELRALFDYCKDTGLVGPRICGQEGSTSEPQSENGVPEICVIDADDLLDDPEGILRKYCASVGIDFDPKMLCWDSEEDHKLARAVFEKWDGFHDDAIGSKDLKPRKHKHAPKSDEQLYSEWVEKYGQNAADMIKHTVDANVGTYEYLKQFAIKV